MAEAKAKDEIGGRGLSVGTGNNGRRGLKGVDGYSAKQENS